MPRHRDQLIDELSERIQTFGTSGDSTGVLDAAGLLAVAPDLVPEPVRAYPGRP